MLTGFDHVTVVVRDLDQAVASYSRLLGSPPSWRGGHAELGLKAALFGVRNALVELVACEAGAPEAEGLRSLLAVRGEGLYALAFATEDAAACSRALRDGGLRATPPQSGVARGDDGSARSYRTVELSPRETRGVAVLAVERADRAMLLEPGAATAECVDALDHVVIRTAAPDAAIALYGRALGVRLALDRELAGRRMLFFRIGGVTLEVVHDPTLGDADQLWGLAFRVRDIAGAHARLRAGGGRVSEVRAGRKPGTHVFTVRDDPCGVPTLILRDPARE